MQKRTLESANADDQTTVLPVSVLVPKVALTPDVELIIDDILEFGMLMPLFVSPMTNSIENRLAMWPELSYDPAVEKWYLVHMGNNRLRAAIRMGYTHISCSVWPTEQAALYCELGKKCRRNQGWKRLRRERS